MQNLYEKREFAKFLYDNGVGMNGKVYELLENNDYESISNYLREYGADVQSHNTEDVASPEFENSDVLEGKALLTILPYSKDTLSESLYTLLKGHSIYFAGFGDYNKESFIETCENFEKFRDIFGELDCDTEIIFERKKSKYYSLVKINR